MTTHDRLTGKPGAPRTGWSGRWASGPDHLLDQTPGSANRDQSDSDDLNALASLEPGLADAMHSGAWTELFGAPLLARQDDVELRIQERERILQENIASIAHVCERFVTRLGERAELLPVARVNKPARRALERLSAHTEDWAARTLSGPVPRRALAVTREENPDLYENRMVNELVHPILTSALNDRIRRLRRRIDDLEDLELARDEGTHHRRRRLYAFWGFDVSRASEASGQAKDTIRLLESLASWTYSLRGSTLGLILRGKWTGQRSLRRTNLIANDRNYRAAGLVWSAYAKEPAAEETADERQERLSRRHRAFDAYVLCMIVRALGQLGYNPRGDHLPLTGESAGTFHGRWGEIALLRHRDGVVELDAAGQATRFVPLLDLVGAGDGHPEIAERWDDLESGVAAPTVVAYLAPTRQILSLRPPYEAYAQTMLSAGPDSRRISTLTGVPVSPLETTSLERLARAVAVSVQLPTLLNYPKPILLDGDRLPRRLVEHLHTANIGQPGMSPLFHRPDKDSIFLRRPLTPGERSNLDSEIRVLEAGAKGPGWERDHRGAIGSLGAAVAHAEAEVLLLLACPLCGTRAQPFDVGREGDVFAITCKSCDARWGHERCGSRDCGKRIPIIEPVADMPNPEVSGPGWVERIYGQDALASPCWARTIPGRYVCPACRDCSVSRTANGSACSRCRALQ